MSVLADLDRLTAGLPEAAHAALTASQRLLSALLPQPDNYATTGRTSPGRSVVAADAIAAEGSVGVGRAEGAGHSHTSPAPSAISVPPFWRARRSSAMTEPEVEQTEETEATEEAAEESTEAADEAE